MNLKYALATAGLMLLGAVSANALPVTIGISTSDNINYTGLLTNTSPDPIDIGADSIFDISNPSNSVVSDSLADDIFNGLTLTGGGGTHSFNFAFDQAVLPNNVFVAVKDLNDNVVGTSVPEPGSVALLVGMTMSGGLFLARRRK
ncbi:MAG TPA: PEP-CTERM sorting domain-containing protein [Chthonomonadaceae bacterium]|nr:PEP-CTERM sorting domain-containing protein [Chthonomonadaceae bacterium]